MPLPYLPVTLFCIYLQGWYQSRFFRYICTYFGLQTTNPGMKISEHPPMQTGPDGISPPRVSGASGQLFSDLYERYWAKVYHFASLYLRDREEIKDVVQEIFLKLWESGRLNDDYKNIENFLFIVTRNHVFNLKRRKSFNEDFFELTLQTALNQPYDIAPEIETENMRQLLDSLIESMPPQRQRVFNLSRKECLTNRQIAEELSISEKMVEKHISQALKFLRANLSLFSIFMM